MSYIESTGPSSELEADGHTSASPHRRDPDFNEAAGGVDMGWVDECGGARPRCCDRSAVLAGGPAADGIIASSTLKGNPLNLDGAPYPRLRTGLPTTEDGTRCKAPDG